MPPTDRLITIATARRDTELVTLSEMASRLAMRPRTFRALARREQLPRVRINGRLIRYEPERILAIITERFAT
jgi:hypothetical protein